MIIHGNAQIEVGDAAHEIALKGELAVVDPKEVSRVFEKFASCAEGEAVGIVMLASLQYLDAVTKHFIKTVTGR